MISDLTDEVRDELISCKAIAYLSKEKQIDEIKRIILDKKIIDNIHLDEVAKRIRDEVFGAGQLQKYLDTPGVTDLMINGVDNVWIEKDGILKRVNEKLEDLSTFEEIREYAFNLVSKTGKRLDDQSPIADALLPDGIRVHAVLEPICGKGAVVSLRVPSKKIFTLEQLRKEKTVNEKQYRFTKEIIYKQKNILITGGTGSGKTTLLSALMNEIDENQRIICIEEVKEIQIKKDNIVSLTSKKENVEGAGKITLTDLVIASLRMRPDRIVLGECRGAEIKELLMALNTGHSGSMSTVHANSIGSVPARIEMLGSLAGITEKSICQQTYNAIDYVFHMKRDKNKNRILESIGKFGIERNKLVCKKIHL